MILDTDTRKGQQHIEPGDGARRFLHTHKLFGNLFAHGIEQLVFHLDAAVVRAEDAALELF